MLSKNNTLVIKYFILIILIMNLFHKYIFIMNLFYNYILSILHLLDYYYIGSPPAFYILPQYGIHFFLTSMFVYFKH